MILLIQRVSNSKVEINNKDVASINNGFLVLVSFTNDDNHLIIDKMIDKLLKIRLFEDNNHKINLSIFDVDGEILSVSQFSLYANCKKGNRPSLERVLPAIKSEELFNYYKDKLSTLYLKSQFGIFKEDMKVTLTNNGPLTIILDSKEIYG